MRSSCHNRYYVPPSTYEGSHRWDLKATWTEEELKKITRKLGKRRESEEAGCFTDLWHLDLRVTLVACICFAALQLDRGNVSGRRHPVYTTSDSSILSAIQIGNALSDGMLKDLHLTTNQYNTGQVSMRDFDLPNVASYTTALDTLLRLLPRCRASKSTE